MMNMGVNRFNPVAARQDTVRARITPEEAAILELLGGAGVQNPNTGAYHFYDPDSGYGGRDSGNSDSSDSDSSSGSDSGGSGSNNSRSNDNDNDSYSRNYQAMGEAYGKWKEAKPSFDTSGKSIVGALGGALTGNPLGFKGLASDIAKYAGAYNTWNKTAPYGSQAKGGSNYVQRESRDSKPSIVGYDTAGLPIMSSSPVSGGSIYPSVYTDPVTGRLLYQSQSVGGTSNLSYADQQLLDKLMGTNVATQNIQQQVGLLNDTIKKLKAAGADTSYYEQELARLQGLGSQSVSANNPLLQAVDSGVSARAANQLTENTAANQLRAGEEARARRGMGTLGSPMNDQIRASLGLSTAQARTQNQSVAEKEALANRMSIMSLLKNSQNQDYTQEMGRTGIGMTLGDWENQRKIAEIAQANQNKQFGQSLDYMQGLQDDANRNAWIGAIGNVAGSIDWGDFF